MCLASASAQGAPARGAARGGVHRRGDADGAADGAADAAGRAVDPRDVLSGGVDHSSNEIKLNGVNS